MTKIVVSRPAEGYVDRLRSYHVLVDGETVTRLRRGEDATIPVAAGRHTVRARIDWGGSRSVDLDLRESDCAYLRCEPAFGFSLLRPKALLYATIWRNRWIDLQLLRVDSAG